MGVHKGVSYGCNQCQYKGNQQSNLKNTYLWYMKEKGMAVVNMTQPLVSVGILKHIQSVQGNGEARETIDDRSQG